MKHVVVTGAARGFGREIALKAHKRGYSVLASVRAIDDAARSLQAAGIVCETMEMRDAASIDAFSKRAKEWCSGDLYALINNAGIAYPAPVEMLTTKDLMEQFQINVFGHIYLTQSLLETLRRNKGRIVMMSSQGAVITSPMVGAYSASKRALEALTEALAMEVGDEVDICILRPGSYATSIWDSSLALGQRYNYEQSRYQSLAWAVQKLVQSRSMKPASDLADVVMHILESRNLKFIYEAPLSSSVMIALRKILPNRLYFGINRFVISRTMRGMQSEASVGAK